MFTKCPKCGAEVEINKMPEAHRKFSQGGPHERLPNTPVACPNCKNSFSPKESYLERGQAGT